MQKLTRRGVASIKPLPSIETLEKYLSYDAYRGRILSAPGHPYNKAGVVACNERADGYRHVYLTILESSGGSYAAHRIAWKLYHRREPLGVIDHINGVRNDNRIENLRDISPSENAKNNHGSLWRDTQSERRERAMAERLAAREHRERSLLAKLKAKYEPA